MPFITSPRSYSFLKILLLTQSVLLSLDETVAQITRRQGPTWPSWRLAAAGRVRTQMLPDSNTGVCNSDPRLQLTRKFQVLPELTQSHQTPSRLAV